jgi:hypothetical protein
LYRRVDSSWTAPLETIAGLLKAALEKALEPIQTLEDGV